jgi:DNA-binding NarL/FixJ family response regulator
MRSTKRVILANGARLLREMLHRVIDKADHLEVIQEISDDEALPKAIEEFEPEWVIVSASFSDSSYRWIREFPSVGFVFVSPSENIIRMKCPTAYEENYSDLSLRDFIHILEKDLQPLDT